MQTKAVIFDMDGVLVDSEAIICDAAIRMFAELGITAQPDDFIPFIGAGEDRYIGGVAEKYGIPYNPTTMKTRTYAIYLELISAGIDPFPGVAEFVRACRESGRKIAVASSADMIKVEANLHAIQLPPSEFDVVFSAEKVEHKKPAPDIFLAAAKALGVDPSHCLVVEDAVNGVQAAKSAGMVCIAVAQSFEAADLEAAGADLVRSGTGAIKLEDLEAVRL